MSTVIFTYGTLKKGFRNNVLLKDAAFLGEGKTKPLYKMFKCESGRYPFPALVKVENGLSVQGELYEVDKNLLERLDRLEGVPFLYKRDPIELESCTSKVIAYFYQQDVSEMKEIGTSWVD